MTVTQAIGTAFRSQPRPGQWNPYRGPVPPPNSGPKEQRKPIIAIPVPPPPPVERTWFNDRRLQSRWVLVKDGKDFETLYTIGALAEALGKSAVTIRRWIQMGVIPDPKLKTGPIEGTPGNSRRRLWTRAQIETIVSIGHEEGVLTDAGPRDMSASNFSERVREAWAQNGW